MQGRGLRFALISERLECVGRPEKATIRKLNGANAVVAASERVALANGLRLQGDGSCEFFGGEATDRSDRRGMDWRHSGLQAGCETEHGLAQREAVSIDGCGSIW